MTPMNLRLISIEPSDRSVLHERIAKRFEVMMSEGFLDEMKVLRQNPSLHPDLPSMRAVGYRQAWDHLDGHITFSRISRSSDCCHKTIGQAPINLVERDAN